MGNSLMVQWLGLHTFTVLDVGFAPGWVTKIPQVLWCSQKKKKSQGMSFNS